MILFCTSLCGLRLLWCFLDRFCLFFFKQKTAYEMRISDWSSDVCSSDLRNLESAEARYRLILLALDAHKPGRKLLQMFQQQAFDVIGHRAISFRPEDRITPPYQPLRSRSEEHTSELQSLMRSSYAVFCLKKKKEQPSENH